MLPLLLFHEFSDIPLSFLVRRLMLGCVIVPVVLSGETFIGWRWVWHELIFFVDGIFYFTFFFLHITVYLRNVKS